MGVGSHICGMTRPSVKVRCALFDFDGVIADTEPLGIKRIVEALDAHDVSFPRESLLSFIGIDEDQATKVLARNGVDIPFDELMEAVADRPSYYETGELTPMPGVIEFISGLRARGILTGLVSSTQANWILPALNHLCMTSLFDSIVCGDMVERHKPDPMCYERSLENLGMAPDEGMAFEDSPAGIAAAKAAGLFVVGFEGSVINQDTSAADIVLPSFEGADPGELLG